MSRRSRVAALVCAALLLSVLEGCQTRAKGVPVEPDLTGVSIVVWDADQPAAPGAPAYRAEAARVVRDFCARYKVDVDLQFIDRQSIVDFLSGRKSGEGPALAFSTEWPLVPEAARDAGPYLVQGGYLDAAIDYWRQDGRTLAIPSYVHWLCAGSRMKPAGETGETGAAMPERTVYLSGSLGFLRSVLDLPGAGWDAGVVASFLSWVKAEYGALEPDPLGAWSEGSAEVLYPVTPFLLTWMKSAAKGEVEPLPLRNPFGEARFCYTVPGYMVLAANGLERECATRLGKELAANLGRWAARAVGGMPALADDMAVFNIESHLGYPARLALLSSLTGHRFRAPSAQEFLLHESIEEALSPVAADFLSGKTGEGDLLSSIQDILERHTRP
jgi:hypothetical protein